MSQHNSGRRQHYIPQMMIQRFAGSDGKLVEMVKPEMRIGTRRRSPSGILYVDEFYQDSVSNLDNDLYANIEQNFARIYDDVLARRHIDGHGGGAFVSWISSMLSRTRLVASVAPMQFIPPAAPIYRNIFRGQMYDFYLDLIVRQEWIWKYRKLRADEPRIVLTDHPVVFARNGAHGPPVIFAPISSDTLLVGGRREDADAMIPVEIVDLNFFLAAHAYRHIFAASIELLESVRSSLFDETRPLELREAAMKPLNGIRERIRLREIAKELPDNFDGWQAMQDEIETYGRPRWEANSDG